MAMNIINEVEYECMNIFLLTVFVNTTSNSKVQYSVISA